MLDLLRKRKRSWIITFFLGIIILVFALFYGGTKLRDPSSPDVAEVNGEPITRREFALSLQRAMERYREIFKVTLTPELVKAMNLKGAVLEELIERRLLLQEARRLGLAVTDDELANFLARIPEFHDVNRRFNKERYLQVLRANRLTPAQFEEEQRENLTVQRLYAIVLDSVRLSEAEARERYRFEREMLNLRFVRVSAGDFIASAKVTEEEIKKFYERNQESLKDPLRVQVEYLAYPFERFTAAATISEKEIEEFYQAHRDDRFHSPKQAKVRYILVRPAGPDAGQKEEARRRASRIVAEARAGKDFAQLARRQSDDPTAARGGDLGWLAQGQLPPELDKPIFALAKGEIGGPVESPAGFSVFKVEEIKPEKTQTLQEAMPEIRRALLIDKSRREAGNAADRDRARALSGADFARLAKESGATLSTTRHFAAGEILPEIGPAPDFYKNALSLGPKEISPVIEGPNAFYILRVKDRKEPSLPPLETVRSKIEKGLTESKARELMLQQANTLLDQLKKSQDLEKVAAEHGLKVEETGWFPRGATQIPKIGDLQELRGGSLGISAQKPVAERVFVQKDAAFLLALKDRRDADMAEFEKEKETFMKQVLAESRQRLLEKLKDGLKAKAKIELRIGSLEEL
ncbi:MAG TPA: SurA N-terminal domain-containing protein [candidate division Zixibacteria bacterium]|nr:SurA N-terminal domain-containing protein [candidate division Zixibacteria bacterium]